MIVYQLTRPFHYLLIRHPEKWKFDWLIPFLFQAISFPLFIFYEGQINIFGVNGFVDSVFDFIAILPGFYIAALAAIATFGRKDIDKAMPKPTPSVSIRIGKDKSTIELSRRRFLSMLFAFLTSISFLLALISIFCQTFAVAISAMIPESFRLVVVGIFVFSYLFMLWQLITATFFGLYYLGDRLHQPDQD